MKIAKSDIEAIKADASIVENLLANMPKSAQAPEKKVSKLQGVFAELGAMLPDPGDKDPVFVKQKVMRKLQRKWSRASMQTYETTKHDHHIQVGAHSIGDVINLVFDRYMWLDRWMIDEITRQIDDDDPELDELWEEQKREEGIEEQDLTP